jgi:hypothetical protein
MFPEIRKMLLDGKREEMLNSSAVIELARATNSPEAHAFLKQYHECESDIAREKPFLSEQKIRDEAVVSAFQALGARIVDRS